MDDLLRDFLTESGESLTIVDGEMVKLEADPNNKEVLQKIFRLVHTIKGTCGFVGLPRLEKVAHASENVLGKFRDGVLLVTPDAVTLILESMDCIKTIMSGIEQTEAEPQGDDSGLITRLEEMAASGGGDAGGTVAEHQEFLRAQAAEAAESAAASQAESGVKAEPVEAAPAPVKEVASDKNPAPAGAKAPEASLANQSIRVNVDVIEQLIVMVSELVLTRNQLLEMVRHSNDSEFKVPLQCLSNVTAELQGSVMKTRMQPIGNAWSKLPRIVRDLANELGKKIELQMCGADTELDRQVLELIKDPLTHMIRNSADHGLETPAERKATGKSDTGVINLRALHEGGHIIVEIADDGIGLAIDKIRAKALANGIVTESELARMSDAQINRFIFHAGLSTAQKVTNVSGRGVGMDVVRSNIELIGGSIDLKSKEGHGTTFTIKIPLTMAIVSALIVGVHSMRFAIPQICVMELVRAAEGTDTKIERINTTSVLRLRDRLLPLVRLSEVLSLPPIERTEAPEAYIVVAQAGGQTFGIVVDTVFDTGEIVVKPVCSILKEIPLFSGNTILGDGSVIMILDPNGVASAVSGEVATRAAAANAAGLVVADREQKQAMLLFRAGSPEPKAVLLGAVTRLEVSDATKFERSDGRCVLQYRGALMPIITSLSGALREEGGQPVLVFSEGEQTVGVAVDEILDIVDANLRFELTASGSGVIGTAVVRDKATEVIDISHHVGDVFQTWFTKRVAQAQRRHILLVDDSPFFRTMVAPLLMSAGYDVTEAATAELALKFREEGKSFNLILSDIDMPGMGGRKFASAIIQDSQWGSTPVIGMAADTDSDELGTFDVLARKFDREGLLEAVRGIISSQERAA
ncbi:MAG: chemotaxis protein CheW [Alphaproteobacteria bacterium]|nr:chemotaxis protein CheW [Alphaproteobacteria bacterium]